MSGLPHASIRSLPNLFGKPMQRIRSDSPTHPPAFRRLVGSLVVWIRSPFSIDGIERWTFNIVPERDVFGLLADCGNFSNPTEAAQAVERFLGALSEAVISAQVSAAMSKPHAAPRQRKRVVKKAKSKKKRAGR